MATMVDKDKMNMPEDGKCSVVKPFWQGMLYYIAYSFMYTLSLFPLRLLYYVSDFIYLILYKIVGYRARLVRKNLRDSFPEKEKTELRQIERDFYHWFCDYMVETIKLFSISESEMKRRMRFENPEEMNNSMSNGHSVTLYLGHYCNWEWVSSLGIYVGKEFVGAQIYHELENHVFNRLLLAARGRFGVRSIEMKESFATLVSLTHQGKFHTTGYISDQVPGYSGMHYWPTFLNHPLTPVYSGAERVARVLNTTCYYIDIQRKKRGYYSARFVKMCETPDELAKFEITGMYFRLLENSIRRQPHLWLWSHNRWKRTWDDFCQCYPDEKKREMILRKL